MLIFLNTFNNWSYFTEHNYVLVNTQRCSNQCHYHTNVKSLFFLPPWKQFLWHNNVSVKCIFIRKAFVWHDFLFRLCRPWKDSKQNYFWTPVWFTFVWRSRISKRYCWKQVVDAKCLFLASCPLRFGLKHKFIYYIVVGQCISGCVGEK